MRFATAAGRCFVKLLELREFPETDVVIVPNFNSSCCVISLKCQRLHILSVV